MLVLTFVIFLLLAVATVSVCASGECTDPEFSGPNITHQAILISKDMKPIQVGNFVMLPLGEHSFVFEYDHKRFAKLTANAQRFKFIIDPAKAPSQLTQGVEMKKGDFSADLNSSVDISLDDDQSHGSKSDSKQVR